MTVATTTNNDARIAAQAKDKVDGKANKEENDLSREEDDEKDHILEEVESDIVVADGTSGDCQGPSSSSSQPPPVWKKLWDSMNPAVCLTPVTACTNVFMDDDEIVDYNSIVPPWLRDMKHPGKPRTAALQRLYRFTDRDRHKNRVPVICSTRFHTLEALIPCLGTDAAAHDRRQALLVLNNLCIPSENKRTILLGPSRDELFSALLEILRQKLPECHLVMACLFNLSFYEETKGMLLHYVPVVALQHTEHETPEQYNFSQPTEKKDSLLRILEQLVSDFLPYYVKHRNSLKYGDPNRKKVPQNTVEASTLRWTMCLFRNLANDAEHATLLATTTRLPAAALQILKIAGQDADLSQWSHDSLPEACLVLWVWLVQASNEACRHLQQHFLDPEADLHALKIFEPIAAQPGIQGVRAKMISNRLQVVIDDDTTTSNLNTMASF